MRRSRVLITAPVLAAGLLLAGCANDDAGSDSQTEETSAPDDTSSEGDTGETGASPTDDSSPTRVVPLQCVAESLDFVTSSARVSVTGCF